MNRYEILPFYFPTTVVFVDDSASFLDNLILHLNPNLAFRLFDSAAEALVMVNMDGRVIPENGHFFAPYPFPGDLPYGHRAFDLNLDLIHREVHNEHRFEQVSVVVVDYEMPSIDGLKFCRSIQDPAVKKILLTGKADEKIAVRAFNEGIIDRFITKQDPNATTVLNEAIAEMQQAYFRYVAHMLHEVLKFDSPVFLYDILFANRFGQICKELDIVEYYLCGEPDGMLLIDTDGIAYQLIIKTDKTMLSHFEIAYAQAAPEGLLTALKSGRMMPNFWRTRGEYTAEIQDDWSQYLHPAMEFLGVEWYSYALVRQPPAFKMDYIYPYRSHLNNIDAMGWGAAPEST